MQNRWETAPAGEIAELVYQSYLVAMEENLVLLGTRSCDLAGQVAGKVLEAVHRSGFRAGRWRLLRSGGVAQQLAQLGVADARNAFERDPALGIAQGRIGSGGEEPPDALRLAHPDGIHQRHAAARVLKIDVRSRREKALDERRLAFSRRGPNAYWPAVKLSDVFFALGDTANEKVYRQKMYGALTEKTAVSILPARLHPQPNLFAVLDVEKDVACEVSRNGRLYFHLFRVRNAICGPPCHCGTIGDR